MDLHKCFRTKAHLKVHIQEYYQWKVSIDDEGYVCIQSRKNTPNTRLGWGVFEKDLYSRL